jgi:alkylation response protein AidB-like acyl-CoA dehydrogenase
MLIEEKYEGIGGMFMDLCPILEEMGRAAFPSPFLATAIMGATILSTAASETIKNKLLPSIADGEVIVTLAAGETGDDWSENEIMTKAEKQDKGYLINGTKLFVPYAHVSDYIICIAKDESAPNSGTSIFLVDAKTDGLKFASMPSISIDRYSRIDFKDVKVAQEDIIGKPGEGWSVIENLLPIIVASRCLEMVGGMQKVLEMTVKWVKEREQFGAPLGVLQSVQHHCAEMAIDVETSRFITYEAAWNASNNTEAEKTVSMAKAWTGDAYQRIAARAHQLHGATGFTEEYDLHFYTRQAKALQLMYGGPRRHRQIVADAMGY